jgi:hypothetical protein
MNRWVSLVLVVLGVSGCSGMTLSSRYQAIGQYGAPQAAGPKVAADKVEVFVQSAPEGFSLEKNELSVVEGYNHRVLGTVKVVRQAGFCDMSDVGMKDVVKLLQAETAAHGGNAVIYVESLLSDPSNTGERCSSKALGADDYFGIGWAVIRGTGSPVAKPPATKEAEPSNAPSGDNAVQTLEGKAVSQPRPRLYPHT